MFEKVKCMLLMAVGNIQVKSRFTVAERDSWNSTVAEDEILVFDKNNVKT